jgi:head-tail adaptor
MLPSNILKQLRKTTNRWLTQTATIERQTEDRGPFGEQIHDFETVASGVACRVITAGSSFRGDMESSGNQELMLDRYRIIFPAGTAVDVDYRVTIGSRVYNVVGLTDARQDETDVHVIATRER